LNGIAIVVGGKNIIPIETSTDATTKSITKNGKKTTKPILNAVFSSDSTNDGINTYVGTSFLFLGFSNLDIYIVIVVIDNSLDSVGSVTGDFDVFADHRVGN
jgi:hypothetical protein